MAGDPEKVKVGSGSVPRGEAASAGDVSEAVRAEITQVIAELIMKAQELGFELATIECPHASNCAICAKAREVVKAIKKLVEIQRRLVGKTG